MCSSAVIDHCVLTDRAIKNWRSHIYRSYSGNQRDKPRFISQLRFPTEKVTHSFVKSTPSRDGVFLSYEHTPIVYFYKNILVEINSAIPNIKLWNYFSRSLLKGLSRHCFDCWYTYKTNSGSVIKEFVFRACHCNLRLEHLGERIETDILKMCVCDLMKRLKIFRTSYHVRLYQK